MWRRLFQKAKRDPAIEVPKTVAAPLQLSVKSTKDEIINEALRYAFRNAARADRRILRRALPSSEIVFDGITFFVHPRDNYTELRIWLDGHPPEKACLAKLIELVREKKTYILDIGANCGAYSIPLAAAVGENGVVIAVEPNPVMVERLKKSVALNNLNGVIRVETCALGEKIGTASLYLKKGNYGEASLEEMSEEQTKGAIEVQVRSILEFAEVARDFDMSVIKIDVEGAEPQALGPLLDAEDWLPDHILMETAHAKNWSVDLIAKIVSLGYQITLRAEGNTLFSRKAQAA